MSIMIMQVLVKLLSIMVSPDGVKDTDQIFTKKISDGFEYVLDANGNVMKDTAGNDIKLEKFKEITCTLIETQQFKSVEIRGEVEITSWIPIRLSRRNPLVLPIPFEHSSARAIGDVGALTEEAFAENQAGEDSFPYRCGNGDDVYRNHQTCHPECHLCQPAVY